MTRPLAIDLFCGLFGWSEGLTQEGWRTVGYDIEDMHANFGLSRPPHCEIIIQDVLTLHGSQFKDATLIVASPPCQEYSYMAMPWSLAKAKAKAIRADTTGNELERLNCLFNACFRIQKEASFAAGRVIPLIVENVKGAQPWVGRARWNFGSFYLWGDVPALMPVTLNAIKVPSFRFDGSGKSFQTASVETMGRKTVGMNWSDRSKRGQDFTRIAGQQAWRRTDPGKGARFTSRDCGIERQGWFNDHARTPDSISSSSSSSPRRKMASAIIAKIPLPLSRHIGAVFR